VNGVRPPINAEALRAAAGRRWVRITVEDEIGSTNAVLAADLDAPPGSVLVAEHQTAGRGRLARTWSSPPRAGLTFSVLIRPAPATTRWGWLPLLTGVALREAIEDAAGVTCRLKWPNDLLAADGERKLAGILATGSGETVVVGVGLNVTTSAAELPVATGTSLALCGARTTDRSVLLAAVLRRLDHELTRWEAGAGDAAASGLAGAYKTVCVTIGRQVRATGVDGVVTSGRAVELDADGRLVLVSATGRVTLSAGDVEHLRAG
jgi:BirA family biotin operon repressor/biotin-[acetyl-CoA-carboxylase] ligase